MKPQLLTIDAPSASAFSVRQDIQPQQHNNWHYHEELELIHIAKGTGTQLVGDSISNFENDSLFLIGSNLPHYWLFDERFLQNNADIRVAHFKENCFGLGFFNLAENRKIRELFIKAKRGMQIYGQAKSNVKDILERMVLVSGTQKIILLLEVLDILSKNEQIEKLTSPTYVADNQELDYDRLNSIITYATLHFKNKIALKELADVIGMTENSFCRFFKTKTGKTPIEFITELRVGHAVKLLLESSTPIKQICFESGFQNFVSFHKAFKRIKGAPPLVYQKSIQK